MVMNLMLMQQIANFFISSFIQFVWLLILVTTTITTAMPTDIPVTAVDNNAYTHIVSFVNPKQANRPRQEFDFDRNEAEATNSVHVQQLFGSLLQLQIPNSNESRSKQLTTTDDSPATERNTLDDELSLDGEAVSEQHESSTETPDAWPRIKLAIPVLEPVKHLLNAVGGGNVNDTHVRTNSHRLIGHRGVHHEAGSSHHGNGNSSSAIETEEDRETAIDSTGFDLLETLGTAGTVIWGMLQNLRKLFAASAGNASTAFSGGGGGGGGGLSGATGDAGGE